MRQAILTRYFGPTNSKGAKIIARAYAGSVTHYYDHSLDPSENHKSAALKLMVKFGWAEKNFIVGGQLRNCDYCFVQLARGEKVQS